VNEKNKFCLFAVVAGFILGCTVVGGLWFIYSSAHKPDNGGVEKYQERERDLLNRIGEYEQREKERTAREKARIAGEDRRIRAEGERIARTETLLRPLWGFDRSERQLHEDLAKEINILADFYFSVKREYDNAYNRSNSKIDISGSE
jgi:hypothetical protein